MRTASLPSYATAISPGKIEVDADKLYPEILEELMSDANWPEPVVVGADGKNPKFAGIYRGLQHTEVDQYWLEVAFQCMKMDVQASVVGTELMPKLGGALCIFVKDSKPDGAAKYAQKAYPEGRGIAAATNGREAREHYKRIRGGL